MGSSVLSVLLSTQCTGTTVLYSTTIPLHSMPRARKQGRKPLLLLTQAARFTRQPRRGTRRWARHGGPGSCMRAGAGRSRGSVGTQTASHLPLQCLAIDSICKRRTSSRSQSASKKRKSVRLPCPAGPGVRRARSIKPRPKRVCCCCSLGVRRPTTT